MINEVLFMELRLLRMFREKHGFSGREANAIFVEHKIWDYIESCYDSLHVSSDECVLREIEAILKNEGVEL